MFVGWTSISYRLNLQCLYFIQMVEVLEASMQEVLGMEVKKERKFDP
jgi:hypothetical protein